MKLPDMNWGGAGYPDYQGYMKGDHSAAEQQAADAQRAQEDAMMQQQLNFQMQQINSVNSVLNPIIAAGGMSPQQQAAETSLFMNQLPADFNATQGQISQNLAARGISGGPTGAGSGDIARNFGQLGAMEDLFKAQGLNQIQVQKAQQLQQALGMKLGIGSMFGQNIGTFNSGAIGSLNAGVTAANNADQAATSWMGPLFGGLGALGGGWASGGFKHG